ncbi:hypothetical protein LTR53_008266 [Teratosphaeriaceae sp. CCFEE 6253]|nr:hypothetical protein LTR53_008266 [Teratosphaeriaceae sp. CCFEE 6253]
MAMHRLFDPAGVARWYWIKPAEGNIKVYVDDSWVDVATDPESLAPKPGLKFNSEEMTTVTYNTDDYQHPLATDEERKASRRNAEEAASQSLGRSKAESTAQAAKAKEAAEMLELHREIKAIRPRTSAVAKELKALNAFVGASEREDADLERLIHGSGFESTVQVVLAAQMCIAKIYTASQ